MTFKTNELRIVLTVEDFEAAVESSGKVLGVGLAAQWDQPQRRGGVFEVPHATLGILDAEKAAGVDDFEVGRRVSGPVRLALGVEDIDATFSAGTEAGATTFGVAMSAPWGDRVPRVESPDGMRLTLFSRP